jgi:hypothetical protein
MQDAERLNMPGAAAGADACGQMTFPITGAWVHWPARPPRARCGRAHLLFEQAGMNALPAVDMWP